MLQVFKEAWRDVVESYSEFLRGVEERFSKIWKLDPDEKAVIGFLAFLFVVVCALVVFLAGEALGAGPWRWEHFGRAPFADSREEAMAGRENVFRSANLDLPNGLVAKLMDATSRPGETALIPDRLDWMISKGGVIHRNVVVAVPSNQRGTEFWEVGWAGKVYRIYLPLCYNWCGAAGPVPVVEIPIAPKTPVAPPVVPVAPAFVTNGCPQGYRLIANVWSLAALPSEFQEEARQLAGVAEGRDSKEATDPEAYEGDAFSRTLGGPLRRRAVFRAVITADLRVRLRDPKNPKDVRELGVLRIVNGQGSFPLPVDPQGSVIETIWPPEFLSPVISGGERRIWLFPDEWGDQCTMNVHGLVP